MELNNWDVFEGPPTTGQVKRSGYLVPPPYLPFQKVTSMTKPAKIAHVNNADAERTATSPRSEAPISLLDEIQGPISAKHLPRTIDRLESALERMLAAMPEFEGGGPLVDQLGEEMAFLRAAARETCRQAGVAWTSKFEQERWQRWIRPGRE